MEVIHPHDETLYDAEYYVHDRQSAAINYEQLAVASRWLQALRAQCVVDIGCGQGFGMKALWNAHSQWVGLDASPARLRQRVLELPVVCGDAQRLPFRSQSVDLAILWSVMDHLRDPAEALREAHRVLRRPGWLLLQSNLTWCTREIPPELHRHHTWEYSANGFMGVIRQAGFKCDRVFGYGWPSKLTGLIPWRLRSPFGYLQRYGVSRRLSLALGRMCPSAAFSLVVLASK